MEVEGGRIRRRVESGRIERAIVGLGLLGALAWLPFMLAWWTNNGWPAFAETYFVGLVVFPAAIFAAGKLIAGAVTAVRRWRHRGDG